MSTLVHPITGEQLPVTLTPFAAGEILGVCEQTVRNWVNDGRLPALPRSKYAPIRIPTAKLLRELGTLEEAS